MAQLAEIQDASLLRRRARRRLVGAIALVVLVVIVLPIVLDSEPSPVGRDLTIEIPSQEAGRFNSRVRPPSAPEASAPSGTDGAAPAPAGSQQPSAAARSVAPPSATVRKGAPSAAKEPGSPAREDAEAARARALLEGKGTWVVQLGAFSNPDNVKHLRDKLAAVGVKSYTEAIKGAKGEPSTRVRAGPFDSKSEAERAQKKLAAAGVSPGTVGPR